MTTIVEKVCNGKYREQLCWRCVKATGGCSWSARLEPVEGWKAKKVKRMGYYCEANEGWEITACPQFEEDDE